jgi:dTDP-4-amino-4,6-dideoxygalactose transaminase
MLEIWAVDEGGQDQVRDEFLVFGKPLIGEAEIDEVVESLRSGWIGSGPKVKSFEELLCQYVGVPYVRCVGSCTAALILCLRMLGIGPGDEVLVPSMTFVASANAVEHVGATPVLVDSEPLTALVDLDAAEAAITERTRAFVPVHFAGRPVDMDRLNSIRDRYGIKIVEDAAHAIGTEWHGAKIGTHGNLAAYSFYVTKNITTGEGGAVATTDAALAEEVERLALHGLSLGAWQRFSDAGFKHYEVEEPGFKYNMTDLQASIGLHQLPHLDEWIDARARLWERYDLLLADLPLETPAPPAPETRHARHLYQVLIGSESGVGRDEVLNRLTRSRIGTGVHYRGVHLHPFYARKYGIRPEQLPVATSISDRTLSLPLGPNVSEKDQDDVVEALHDALQVD